MRVVRYCCSHLDCPWLSVTPHVFGVDLVAGRRWCQCTLCGKMITLASFFIPLTSFFSLLSPPSPSHSSQQQNEYGYWWIFLTHMTLTLQTIYHIVSFIVAFQASKADSAIPKHVPRLAKIMWFLQSVSLPGSFFVFVLYWGLVFDGTLKAISTCTHGVNFVAMMVDAYVPFFVILSLQLLLLFPYSLLTLFSFCTYTTDTLAASPFFLRTRCTFGCTLRSIYCGRWSTGLLVVRLLCVVLNKDSCSSRL